VQEPNFKGLCKQFGSLLEPTQSGVSSGSKLLVILIVFFEKKIEENAYFRNSADEILANDKFPSMQRVNAYVYSVVPD
jgi:hypothetical protein